jgi:hypothetical protein
LFCELRERRGERSGVEGKEKEGRGEKVMSERKE